MPDGVGVSVDKISYLGFPSDRFDFDDLLPFWGADVQYNRGLRFTWNLDTIHISAELDKDEMSDDWGAALVDVRQGSVVWNGERRAQPVFGRVRVEFNPNKVDAEELRNVASVVKLPRVTRCDVALDYWGIRPSDFVWMRPGVKSNVWHGRDGIQEALYLGRWKSPKSHRIYDKARELDRDDLTLTRCEAMQRVRPSDDLLPANLFDGVCAVANRIPDDLSFREAARLAAYLYHPEVMCRADRKTRYAARDFAREHCGVLSPAPEEVYRENRDVLQGWVADVMEGRPVPIAEVYR